VRRLRLSPFRRSTAVNGHDRHAHPAVARHRRCLRPPQPDPPPPAPTTAALPSRREANTSSGWLQIHQLKAAGVGTYRIARELRLDPETVRRYAAADSPDDLLGSASTGRRALLDPHKPYLQGRIDGGVIPPRNCCTRSSIVGTAVWAHAASLADRRPRPPRAATRPTGRAVGPHRHRLDHATC